MKHEPHEINQTSTSENVVLVANDQLDALRQSIFRDPEFEKWRHYLAQKRRELSQQVAANEAEQRMSDYAEFIAMEHQTINPGRALRQCDGCNGAGIVFRGAKASDVCPWCGGRGQI